MNAGDASGLPPEAFAAALASMPSMGPARLRALLAEEPPALAWERAAHEGGASVRDVARAWQRHTALGIRVLLAGQPAYPERLEDDPQAPALLFCLGDPAVLADAPTVALVGTRAPTRYGIGVAAQFGADLSATGVSVVSGLALGIDGAAHEGACAAGAPPLASSPVVSTIPTRVATSGCGSGCRRQASSCPSRHWASDREVALPGPQPSPRRVE